MDISSIDLSLQGSQNDDVADEDLEEQYAKVLDHLLFPQATKAELIRNQTVDKKRQMVLMHKSAIEKDVLGSWGESETNILGSLLKQKSPDIKLISHIKTVLTTANKSVLSTFIKDSGIFVLTTCINSRVAKLSLTDMDATVLYEIVSCFKVTMNNETGMEAVLATDDGINSLSRCLIFEWPMLSSLVLEILSCCCYYSERAAIAVIDGLRQWSITRGEKAFAGLVLAISKEDIRTRYDVLSLINQMIMAVDDIAKRSVLRDEFNRMLLTVKVKTSIKDAEREIILYEQSGGIARDVTAISGPRALDLRTKLAPYLLSPSSSSSLMKKSSDSELSVKSSATTATLGASNASALISGYCVMAKSADTKSMVADYLGLGGKKTKRRLCSLDGDTFSYSTEKDVDTIAGTVALSSIVEVRNFTSEASLAKISSFCFEIESDFSKILSFGCETAAERDSWVNALRLARENKSSQSEFSAGAKMTVEEARHYLDQYRKNLSLYESIWMEDRKYTITAEGLDTGNFNDILRFVQLQSLAGNTEVKLHELLYQLAVLPPGMEGMWDTVISSAKKYRTASQAQGPGEEIAVRASMNMNSAYQQMSKLALLVITAENEVKALRQRSSTATRRATGMRQSITEYSVSNNPDTRSRSNSPAEAIDTNSSSNISQASIKPSALAIDTGSSASDAMAMLSTSPMAIKKTSSVSDLKADKLVDDTPSADMTAATSTVTTTVDPRFEKFVKMKKLLPEAAVKQKMSIEGFTSQEIDDFIDGKMSSVTPPVKTPSTATTSDTDASSSSVDPRFEKFVKMKKILPEPALRQKMSLDGFTSDEIDAFFNGATATTSSAVASALTAASSDPRYEKFEKMKKMSLPEGAIRQKMSAEGHSQTEIDLFFGEVNPLSKLKAAAQPEPSTPAAIDPALEKYAKMSKMLPEGAVRQKMISDGLSQATIDAFFNAGSTASAGSTVSKPALPSKPAVHQPPPGFTPKPVINPNKKLKALFWTKIDNAAINKTVWNQVASEIDAITSAEAAEVEDWFSAAAPAGKKANDVATAAGDEAKGKTVAISLMDGKKMQNVLIALGKLRMEPAKIVTRIVQLTEVSLSQDVTETLLDIAPSTEEVTAVKNYTGAEDGLDRASALYWHLCKVPRLAQRLECHLVAFKWFPDADGLKAKCSALISACNEIRQSEPMITKILSFVLAIGNYMNGGTGRGQAYGVRLEVLKKLSTIKAEGADRGTIVHFLATIAFNRAPELLDFSDGWTAAWAASEIALKDIEGDLKRIIQLRDKLKSEMNNGVSIVSREAGEAMAQPLTQRLEWFLSESELCLQEVNELKIKAQADIRSLSEAYGEAVDAGSVEDPVQMVLDPLLSFAKTFKQAIEEITTQRRKQEKAAAALAVQERDRQRKQSISGTSDVPLPLPKKGAKENIFANFNNAKSASTESVVEEFKLRLKNRSAAANAANTAA